MFSGDSTSDTQGCRSRTMAADPSLDALSTTHTSASPASAHGCSERRQRSSRSRVFQDTTATTTAARSEEHTSELQSRQYLVCRLLLEKKKKNSLTIISTPSSTKPITIT